MKRCLPLLLLAPLAGCGTGYQGLETQHQPVVYPGVAQVGRCPDWSDQDHGNSESNSANYGCATQTNLALMIADPNDLLRGRTDARAGADIATRAVKAWREITPTAKQWTTTTSVSAKGGN